MCRDKDECTIRTKLAGDAEQLPIYLDQSKTFPDPKPKKRYRILPVSHPGNSTTAAGTHGCKE